MTPTTDQKKLARQLKKDADAANAVIAENLLIQEQKAHYAAYLLTVPKRLMDLVALANWVGVAADVSLTETGAKVRFYADNDAENIYIDTVMTYEVEEWSLENLERKLTNMKKKLDDQVARLRLATEAFIKLSLEEQAALKENIHRLA